MATRKIVYMSLDDLHSADRNAKDHDEELIHDSISRFGLVEIPTLDERTKKIISGHGRRDELRALRDRCEDPPADVRVEKGVWLVPVSRGWASDNDDEALAAGIALNRAGEKGGWKFDELVEDLQSLEAVGFEGMGFGPDDVQSMLAARELRNREDDPEPDVRASWGPPSKPKTKRGDIWELGNHRLLCGDCRDPKQVKRLLAGTTVNVAVTSPPYAEQRDYDESSGFKPIPPTEYVGWFAACAANVAANLADDGSWFVNIKPPGIGLDTHLYVLDLVIAHVREWGWHFATEFCWERVGVPKHVTRRFKNQFEPIYQFTRGDWKIRPDNVRHASMDAIVPLGEGGSIGRDASLAGNQGGTGDGLLPKRDKNGATMSGLQGVPGGPNVGKRERTRGTSELMSDVQGDAHDAGEALRAGFAYPGNRLPTFSGTHQAVGHSAAFPVGLPAWFIRAYSDEGDAVFDPFVGSGSTLLAAEQEGRVGFGIELSPGYCDVICRRFQEATGLVPRRVGAKRPTSFAVAAT